MKKTDPKVKLFKKSILGVSIQGNPGECGTPNYVKIFVC